MTWLKLSDDFSEDCERAGLSDAAYRLHVEALNWTMHRITDGRISRQDLRKLASSVDPELIASELVARDFWHGLNGEWQIHHQMEHQLTPEQIAATAAGNAKRGWQKRQRERGLPAADTDYKNYLSRRDERRDERRERPRDAGLVWTGLNGTGSGGSTYETQQQTPSVEASSDAASTPSLDADEHGLSVRGAWQLADTEGSSPSVNADASTPPTHTNTKTPPKRATNPTPLPADWDWSPIHLASIHKLDLDHEADEMFDAFRDSQHGKRSRNWNKAAGRFIQDWHEGISGATFP